MPMKRKFDDAREQLVHVDVVTSGASQYSLGSLGAGLSFLQVKQLLAIASGVRVGQQRLYPKTPCRGSFLVDDDDGLCNASTIGEVVVPGSTKLSLMLTVDAFDIQQLSDMRGLMYQERECYKYVLTIEDWKPKEPRASGREFAQFTGYNMVSESSAAFGLAN